MTDALLRLGTYTQQESYVAIADEVLKKAAPRALREPSAAALMVQAMDHYLFGPVEVTVLGDSNAPGVQAMLHGARSNYLPHLALRWGAHSVGSFRLVANRPTAYVCLDRVCSQPLHSEAEVLRHVRDALQNMAKNVISSELSSSYGV